MYEYNASIFKIVDGDTLDLVVDLGFRTYIRIRARVKDIDTPEMRGPFSGNGEIAKKFVEDIFKDSESCTVKSYGEDIYARWICDIFFVRDGVKHSLSDYLWENKMDKGDMNVDKK